MTLKFEMQLARDLIAVLPDSQKRIKNRVVVPDWQKTLKGEVLGVGPKVRDDVRVGDRISFGAAKGMESVYNGAAIRIMRYDDVDMVIEEESDGTTG